ncbi:hypothetical protein KP509_06G081700 [Ceratopteris richardii]|uniref:BZIP domain-containing protein n=1 Tax=Ceratopteris richardii TaxID=49495 RepID=A0A8T2UQ20_CERRI|nr:hypothetical protein KP509_06G081700 [Ceratopteris richardii]KAH7435854.1 hypothetical protein KP509_06G081700 [Ceratopteris richardii]
MGYQTQSTSSGHAYSIPSMNSGNPFTGSITRQACPPPPVDLPLMRQKSIYSLTLEEFQNTLGDPGKSFGSMNMEELLKNIWTAEEGQAMAAAMGTADMTGLQKQTSLQKQGSFSIKGALGRKTVDEVWNTIYQAPNNLVNSSHMSMKQREMTFREVTLEDFLVKAGIVPEEDLGQNEAGLLFDGGTQMYRDLGVEFGGSVSMSNSVPNSGMYSSPTSVLAGHIMESQQTPQLDNPESSLQTTDMLMKRHLNGGFLEHCQLSKSSATNVMGDTFNFANGKQADNSAFVSPVGLGGLRPPVGGGITASLNTNANFTGFANPLSLVMPTCHKVESPLSSDGTGTGQGNAPLSPVYHSCITAPLRKRIGDEQLETVVERRQRRMIKNRESAARSRARKQAYTVELENELSELRAENAKLKQKQEKAERQFKKVLAVTQEAPQQQVLVRTRTGPW